MSLVMDDDDRHRGHSGPRSRDQHYQNEIVSEQPRYREVRESSYAYPPDDLDGHYQSSRRRSDMPRADPPYPTEGGLDPMLPGKQILYSHADESARPIYRTASVRKESPYNSDSSKRDHGDHRDHRDHREAEAHFPGAFPENDHVKDNGNERRIRHSNESQHGKYETYSRDSPRTRHVEPSHDNHDSKYNDSRYDGKYDRDDYKDRRPQYLPEKYDHRHQDNVDTTGHDRRSKKERDEEDLAYDDSHASYGFRALISKAIPGAKVSSSQLGDDDRPRLRTGEHDSREHHRDSSEGSGHRSSKSVVIASTGTSERRKHADYGPDSYRDSYDSIHSYGHSYQGDDRRSIPATKSTASAVEPSSHGWDRPREHRGDKLNLLPTLVVESDRRDRDRSRDRRESGRDNPPRPTGHRATLSVDTALLGSLKLASAPPSPMLESYHGTYQDCSPMPSPLALPTSPAVDDLKSIEALSPLNSDGEGSKKLSRRARFHDATDIADRLAQALKGNHAPNIGPLIEILPSLTHEQVMELRAEYKHIVKTGSEHKGVNIAKHIRSRLKDEDPVLMKACYAVALGKWESEAYWANFWYQGDKTRRELLIESLMGRTNDEIRRIKDAFTDRKYDNSLTKCMRTELKEDKFKKAVMMILDESRMEDFDYHGHKLPIEDKQVDADVADLRKAIKSEKGGETLMISIVVQRSERHLRAVLQRYERTYSSNFAREALKKSGNLVGELLAHILNGIINRPVRDALLLNHALTATRKDQLRRELLISRLIRYHWEPAHMQEVKRAYRERYGQDLQDAVKEATTDEWGLFCRELCIARMPDHVRRIERVERVEIIR